MTAKFYYFHCSMYLTIPTANQCFINSAVSCTMPQGCKFLICIPPRDSYISPSDYLYDFYTHRDLETILGWPSLFLSCVDYCGPCIHVLACFWPGRNKTWGKSLFDTESSYSPTQSQILLSFPMTFRHCSVELIAEQGQLRTGMEGAIFNKSL